MDDEADHIIAQAYETVAWRGMLLALLAQVLVPAPDDEDDCSALLDAALSDILNKMVSSEGMPAELDRDAFRAGLEKVNDRLRAELRGARIDREKLRTKLGSSRH